MPDVSEDIKPANPRIFAPSEEKAKEVLNDLACGLYSFVDIAQNHDTTVEALSAWMATDEIAQRLAMIESGPARHARFVATIRMPDAVRALTAALDNLRFEEEHAVTDHRNQRIRELRRRGADTLRKMVALLYRITKFEPLSVRPSRPLLSASSPKGEVARSSEPEGATSATPPTNPRTSPRAPITPESIEELRTYLATLLTPLSPSHSVTSPLSPPHPCTSAPLHPTTPDTLPRSLQELPSLNAPALDSPQRTSTRLASRRARFSPDPDDPDDPTEIPDDPLASPDPPDST